MTRILEEARVDETLAALDQLARLTVGAPPAHLMVGYLLGNVERVRFVSRLEGDVALGMSFGVHRRIEVPMMPWQGYVRGVPIPDPLLWIQAARMVGTSQIAIRVSTDDTQLTRILTPVLEQERQRSERGTLDREIRNLRQEVDRALDIYAEVKKLMDDPQRREDSNLPRFMAMAQSQMEQLGAELSRLKARLEES
jgi:hypothetical protein